MEKMQYLKEMGEKIKKRRNQLKLSQEELAQLTEYKDRSSITRIEKGEVDLSSSKIKLFSAALKVELEYLTKSSYDYERIENLNIEELSQFDKLINEASLFFNDEKVSDEDKDLLHKELIEIFFDALRRKRKDKK